jgi:hypothetical protein
MVTLVPLRSRRYTKIHPLVSEVCLVFPNRKSPEAESKEKHGVWDPLPELTITSPFVHSRVDSKTFTMPESTLSPDENGFKVVMIDRWRDF